MEKDLQQNPISAANEHLVRCEKVKAMREQGIEPWPSEFKSPSESCASIKSLFEQDLDASKKYSIAGRLMLVREHGKTIFADLQDRSGKIQLYIKQDILGDANFEIFKKFFDIGDLMWCSGTLFRTKMGEITLRVDAIEMQSKCLHPLPEKFHGLTDLEQRYRQRYLDLISNPQSREKFIKRSEITQSIRKFLLDNGFLEVETPMLHPIAGGATAKPFVTHHNAYDMDLFLRIAPELYLKKLVVGGLDRVFEINRNFRNEGVSTRHNPEFTMLEFYMAYGNYKDGMDFTEKMIKRVINENFSSSILMFNENELDFGKPFVRLTMVDSILQIGGFSKSEISPENIDKVLKDNHIDVPKNDVSYGEKLSILFGECVERKLIQPTFITEYPVEISPLAKRDPKDPFSAARFELFIGGMEAANGYSELNDPIDQASRFKKQLTDADQERFHAYDADFVKAIEYGLPPTAGVGLGIDRLTMFLTDTSSIKDVILFPAMKNIKE
ncbi:TPA: lysine--tRNA ligase [Candidatus Dependentiae bacterium]|nr:lysine--tRNA ligase [Candidatus Dependentiae bacterium]HBZ73231.1 lysine--tRNA ligase [Candidatus Dependentiae bacterium]